MICPKCGTNNPDYFVYCKKCSEELPVAPLPSEGTSAPQKSSASYDDPEAYRAAQRRAAHAQSDSTARQEGPYYDPRQRHHALDPWELLRDEPEEEEAPRQTAPAQSARSASDRFAGEQNTVRQQPVQERAARQPVVTTHKPRQHTADEYTARSDRFSQPVQERRVVPAPVQRQETPVQKGTVPTEPVQRTSARSEEPDYRPRSAQQSRFRPQQESFSDRTERTAQPAADRMGRTAQPSSDVRRETPAARPTESADETDFYRSRSRYRADRFDDAPAERETASRREDAEQTRRFTRPQATAALPEEEKPMSAKEARAAQRRARQEEKELARQEALAARPSKKNDDLPDDLPEEDEQSAQRSRMINIAFWVVIGLLAIATLFFTYRYLSERYGSIGGAFSSWFGGSSESAVTQPVVEETSYDGMTAHSITVYGDDGETVVFYDPATGEELKRAVLQNGGYKLTIVDLNWIPEEPGDEETMEITPDVTLIDTDGNETKLEVPSFTIAVPQTTLTVTTPDVSAAVSAENGTLTVSGSVEANSATRLFWDDEEITSCIDTTTGSFTYEATVESSGTYQLTASYSRHRNNTVTIQVGDGSDASDAAESTGTETATSELEVTFGTLPSSTENDSQMITGTVPAGSTVTVDGPVSGEVTTTEGGSFSFVADLSSGYGVHTYTVNATFGTATGSASCSIVRSPEIDAYSRKAQIFEYNTVLKNPNDSKGKIYRIDGTVASVEQISDGHQQVLFYVDGDSSQPVLLDYFSTSTLTEGTEYRIFADANGNTEETDSQAKMPRLNAWFAGRN